MKNQTNSFAKDSLQGSVAREYLEEELGRPLNITDDQAECISSYLKKNTIAYCAAYSDPVVFCEVMATRENNNYGGVLFGEAKFAKSLVRDCYVGILEDPKKPAAIFINNGEFYEVHIYDPKEGA